MQISGREETDMAGGVCSALGSSSLRVDDGPVAVLLGTYVVAGALVYPTRYRSEREVLALLCLWWPLFLENLEKLRNPKSGRQQSVREESGRICVIFLAWENLYFSSNY